MPKQLANLLKRPIFTSKEAKSMGMHPALLSYYAKKGVIKRVNRGVYRGADVSLSFQWGDLIEAV